MRGPHRVPVGANAVDLVLALVAFLGGMGLGHTALSPGLAGPPTALAAAWRVETELLARSRLDASPRPAATTAGRGAVPRGQASPEPHPALMSSEPAGMPAGAKDWRQELQRLAMWQRPTEAPAGANRYPIAEPEHAPLMERPAP